MDVHMNELLRRRFPKINVVVSENSEDAVAGTENLADLRRLAGFKHRAYERLVDNHRGAARLGDDHVHLFHSREIIPKSNLGVPYQLFG